MSGLCPQCKHLFVLKKQRVNFSKKRLHLFAVSMITNCPDKSKTKIFLIWLRQTTLNFINSIHYFFNLPLYLIKICLNYRLQSCQIVKLFNYLKQCTPSLVHNMPIINYELTNCYTELRSNLCKGRVSKLSPRLKQNRLICFRLERKFYGYLVSMEEV